MNIHRNSAVLVALLVSAAFTGRVLAAPPATSAYVTDPQHSYVEDATSEQIGTVNMITCIMSALRPDALVNQNPYIALVDQNKCDPNHTSSSAGGGASQAADYMTGTVLSTRASNQDPMVVKTWLDQVEQDKSTLIYVYISATEAPSSSNPYGTFRLDFCGKATGVSSNLCVFNGYLQGSSSGLRFYETDNNGGGDTSTTALQLSTSSTAGQGAIHHADSQSGATDFAFAYDAVHFLRGAQCFSRDATDPETGLSVWRYGLYDASTGAVIDRNSGFPIVYTAADGTSYNGYLGYSGLSLPPTAQAAIQNGDTVQKVDYNGSTAVKTNYTVVKSGGKLMKYTKQLITLDKLDQVRFNTWVNNSASLYAGANPSVQQYEMYWNETTGDFVVDAAMNCGPSGCQTQALSAPLPHVAATFWSAQSGIQGWSQALGGQLFIDLRAGVTPSSGVNVTYRTQDLVYPSEMQTLGALDCVRDCPTLASLTAYFANAGGNASPFLLPNNFNPTATGNVISYTLDAANVALLDGASQKVVFADANATANTPYQWGITSGRLVKASDLASLDCGGSSAGQYCDYRVDALDVYYQWQTGPGNWNQFAAVKNSAGTFVQFDAPLNVNYTVPADPVRYGQYAGQTLVLQYGGYGDLWGIPGYCVSRITNDTVSCDNSGSNTRYVPAFVIPYDTVLGRVTAGSTAYLVKWLEREIRFAAKPLADCAGLTAPTNITLPTAADLKDPSNPSSDIYIGAKPTVTDAPRVIQGEVKY